MAKAVSINKDLLVKVHRVLHEAGRPDLAAQLMRQVGLIQAEHTENLLCPVHAAKFRGGQRRQVYRHVAKGHLGVFRICCRSFVSKQQLKDLPKVGHQPRKVRV